MPDEPSAIGAAGTHSAASIRPTVEDSMQHVLEKAKVLVLGTGGIAYRSS